MALAPYINDQTDTPKRLVKHLGRRVKTLSRHSLDALKPQGSLRDQFGKVAKFGVGASAMFGAKALAGVATASLVGTALVGPACVVAAVAAYKAKQTYDAEKQNSLYANRVRRGYAMQDAYRTYRDTYKTPKNQIPHIKSYDAFQSDPAIIKRIDIEIALNIEEDWAGAYKFYQETTPEDQMLSLADFKRDNTWRKRIVLALLQDRYEEDYLKACKKVFKRRFTFNPFYWNDFLNDAEMYFDDILEELDTTNIIPQRKASLTPIFTKAAVAAGLSLAGGGLVMGLDDVFDGAVENAAEKITSAIGQVGGWVKSLGETDSGEKLIQTASKAGGWLKGLFGAASEHAIENVVEETPDTISSIASSQTAPNASRTLEMSADKAAVLRDALTTTTPAPGAEDLVTNMPAPEPLHQPVPAAAPPIADAPPPAPAAPAAQDVVQEQPMGIQFTFNGNPVAPDLPTPDVTDSIVEMPAAPEAVEHIAMVEPAAEPTPTSVEPPVVETPATEPAAQDVIVTPTPATPNEILSGLLAQDGLSDLARNTIEQALDGNAQAIKDTGVWLTWENQAIRQGLTFNKEQGIALFKAAADLGNTQAMAGLVDFQNWGWTIPSL